MIKLTISNTLIIISILFTITYNIYGSLIYYGMHDHFFNNGDYLNLVIQFIFYNFLHGSLFHLLFNSIFLAYFGNKVEEELGISKYILFFITTTILVGIALLFLSKSVTIGISGFGLALLTYYTLMLKYKGDNEYKGGITAIVINVGIGILGGISFIGHLFGVIIGMIYFYIIKYLHHQHD